MVCSHPPTKPYNTVCQSVQYWLMSITLMGLTLLCTTLPHLRVGSMHIPSMLLRHLLLAGLSTTAATNGPTNTHFL